MQTFQQTNFFFFSNQTESLIRVLMGPNRQVLGLACEETAAFGWLFVGWRRAAALDSRVGRGLQVDCLIDWSIGGDHFHQISGQDQDLLKFCSSPSSRVSAAP